MNQTDIMQLSAASTKEIKVHADFCNLKLKGGIYWAQKSVFCTDTRKEFKLKFSTRTPILKDAVIAALPRVRDFVNRVRSPQLFAATTACKLTVGEVTQAYLDAPAVRARQKTRKANVAELHRVVRLVHGAEFDVAKAPVKLISHDLGKAYQAARLKIMRAELGEDGDQLAEQSTRRAINSALSHAQDIFSAEARDDFRRLNLPPCVYEFAEVIKIHADKAPKPVPLTDEAVNLMRASIVAEKETDLPVWASFQLMLWGGLRNKEVIHARASWLEQLPSGDYRLQLKNTPTFRFKGNATSRVLPRLVVEELLGTIKLEEGEKLQDAFLVQANSTTDRYLAAYNRLQAWLRGLGLEKELGKTAYRLRKYFFKKVEQQQGLALAAVIHGGGNVAMLQKHYTGAGEQMEEALKFPAPVAVAQ